MSLISEALKKAQMEAVRQDRAEQRFYMTHGGRVAGSETSRSYAIVIASFLGACVATGAALFYVTRVKTPDTYVAPQRTVSAPAPVATPATTTIAATQAEKPRVRPTQPAVAVAAPKPPREPVGRETADTRRPELREDRITSQSSARVDTRRTTDETQPAVAAAPSSSRRQSRDGFRDGATYGSPVTGPLGAELTLTGLSSFNGQFVAIVNGVLVRPGATVGPFSIEEIEARRVRVRYVDVSFWLTQ